LWVTVTVKKSEHPISINQYTRLVCVLCLVLGLGFAIVSSVALASTSPQEPQSAPAQPAQKTPVKYPQLPEGPGKETLIKACSKCHSPTNVIANGQAREGWEETTLKMVGLGATGSDEDFTEIVDYLVKNFPPSTVKVNMNKASASEIESQLGFSTKQAEDIVAYREKAGSFKTPEDLKRVPQMDAKEVDARRNRMTFQ
jgi:competence protein ComEA